MKFLHLGNVHVMFMSNSGSENICHIEHDREASYSGTQGKRESGRGPWQVIV
jgi:hypothetical protein